jgi:Fic family protein
MSVSRINELRQRLDALRPLPEGAVRSLRESLALEWTYHSNAIEGNTLTLKETKVVLEGITIGGKSVREHLEAINHAHAVDFLEQVVARKEQPSERLIRELHGLVMKGIDDRNAGAWRRENVLIAGAVHRPPDFLHVPEEMTRLVNSWQQHRHSMECAERAAWLHSEVARVHPFTDGNGRTSRLLMNLELMMEGFPPAVIRKEDRLRYYEALDAAHTGRGMEALLHLVEERVSASLELYLELLER